MSDSNDNLLSVKQEQIQKVLEDHEPRITENEKFRLRMQGAIAVVGFALGGGFVTTILLWLAGVV